MKNKPTSPKCFFVISRFNEDVSWIRRYSTNYVIYNKGKYLPGYKTIKRPNFGGNQYDIIHFIYNNYQNLPDLIAFVQGDPFDHCKREKFDIIINRKSFVSIESYDDKIKANQNDRCRLSAGYDSGYSEINNSWYIKAHNGELKKRGFKTTCPFKSFKQYMDSLFEHYKDPEFIRFSPGSQYLVEKEKCLYYPRKFWKHILNIFPTQIGLNGGTEGHIIERSLWTIFNNIYTPIVKLQ